MNNSQWFMFLLITLFLDCFEKSQAIQHFVLQRMVPRKFMLHFLKATRFLSACLLL